MDYEPVEATTVGQPSGDVIVRHDHPDFLAPSRCRIARRRFGSAARMRMVMPDYRRSSRSRRFVRGDQRLRIDLEARRRHIGDVAARHDPLDPQPLTQQ